MMNLEQVKEAIDQLSPEEVRELHEYLEKRKLLTAPQTISTEERIRRLDAAAKAIREGFTDAEWDEIEQAMNEEYIEPWDESEWKD